jgi:hypothetical protein
MGLFAERTIAFILTNLSFSRRLTAWFGSEEGQKKLPGKTSSVWCRSIRGAEFCENFANWSRQKFGEMTRVRVAAARQANDEGLRNGQMTKAKCSFVI